MRVHEYAADQKNPPAYSAARWIDLKPEFVACGPIPLPSGRQMVTLEGCPTYIQKRPKGRTRSAGVTSRMEALKMVQGKRRGKRGFEYKVME
jgi:hypothetical protein